MATSNGIIAGYLDRYSEPLNRQLLTRLPINRKYVLVIPVYAEPADNIRQLVTFVGETKGLLILVINQQKGEALNPHNEAAAKVVAASARPIGQHDSEQIYRLYAFGSGQILVIDQYSSAERRLAVKHGVGLARKTGADIALQLIASGQIDCHWLFCSDADVSLPDNYFSAIDQLPKGCSIALLPFEHLPANEAALDNAQALYDLYLDYYVAGLTWAGSPYAYHALGSVQIIHAEHYAKVRGFPKRSAGEDFYIQNKLAKTGQVCQLSEPRLQICTRRSQRTPFGTGAALKDILLLTNPHKDYTYYHPEIFAELKTLLAQFPALWQQATDLHGLSKASLQQLHTMGFFTAVERANESSGRQAVFLKHLNDWFDGFRTLKFLRAIQTHYSALNFRELEAALPTPLRSALTHRFSSLSRNGCPR